MAVLLLVFPTWHHHTPLYREVVGDFYRKNKFAYDVAYAAVLWAWIALQTCHLVTITLAVIGLRTSRHRLLRPELISLLLHIGIFFSLLLAVILTAALTNYILWMCTLLAVIYLTASCTYLYLAVWCHRYLSDKYRALMELLANTKTVHFRDSHNMEFGD